MPSLKTCFFILLLVILLATLAACGPATPQLPTAELTATELTAQPGDWWRNTVFYEVLIRSFYDTDGDGVGDLAGLIEKLDYLNDGDPAIE